MDFVSTEVYFIKVTSATRSKARFWTDFQIREGEKQMCNYGNNNETQSPHGTIYMFVARSGAHLLPDGELKMDRPSGGGLEPIMEATPLKRSTTME